MAGSPTAGRYAAALLGGGTVAVPAPHPSLDWARSGAMALTGTRDGPPRLAPGPLAACARAAAAALALLSGRRELAELDGPALLGERAAFLGLRRRGTTAPGGSCRLLRASDGWIAVSLARPDDRALLPAWLGCTGEGDPWQQVAARIREREAEEIVGRARLLGLAAALAVPPPDEPPPWSRVVARGRPAAAALRPPLVVDLSALWAGPLCTHLLGLAGARVVKVESTRRPDGARSGPRGFFDLLNSGKQSVALDFTSPEGVRALRGLLERADVVVESSRPRALAQLGIEAQALIASRPGRIWVSLTGYGRAAPAGDWIGFGDDASVAAGLATATGNNGGPPLFCGDAIADPLAGLHAAVAALRSWREGGGHLIELALRDVVAHCLNFPGPEPAPSGGGAPHGWQVACGGQQQAVCAPRARREPRPARPLGSDTHAVLRELALAC